MARAARGWTQTYAAEVLGLARSTLANIETGRYPIGPELRVRVLQAFPELDRNAARPRPPGFVSGGPFELLDVSIAYVFGHSRSPSEVIETRAVRALRNNAQRYGLSYDKTTGEGFRVDQEAISGGQIEQAHHTDDHGVSWNSSTFVFDARLRKGDIHTFTIRSFIETDPNPDTCIQASFTLPIRRLRIELRFTGPERPSSVRRFGPIDSEVRADQDKVSTRLAATSPGHWALVELEPQPFNQYGLTWNW